MLSVIVSTMMMADDVTPQQALEQASQFVKSRKARGGGPRLAPGTQPKLTLASRVSDLYVFNINGDAGYVIVSNDDVAVPILGYSDSGSFDPNNIPDNMRAWLQGYADEIAWAKKHAIKVVDETPHVLANAPRLTEGTAVKAAVAPLLKTTWNQDAPYNNNTPYYGEDNGYYVFSKTYVEGYDHCATGCVATAMAQVMKYHEWPKSETPEIPNYTWANFGDDLDQLVPTTFDWEHMKDSYTGSETDATATAVATLMQYCGWSVQMNYGRESSSNTDKVVSALKTYYGYKNTTQLAVRSYYSYANWIELIYHEVANKRPVVYGGQSSGGGHEFVVDGYQGEDFFHINWGWGGSSDNYFKLSSLNPYQQGIGGSSSSDGFHYGQDAAIGIQPSGASGTVAEIPQNVIDLTLESMTLSSTIVAAYTSVDITMRVTNNSANDYDGTLFFGAKYGDTSYSLLQGEHFFIPAGETKDCVITYTPTNTGDYDLVFFVPNPYGSYWTDTQVWATLTVTGSSGDNSLSLTPSYHIDNPLGMTVLYSGGNPVNVPLVYGSSLKATVTLTNENSDAYIGVVGWTLEDNDNLLNAMQENLSLAAGESKTYNINLPGLAPNTIYYLYCFYTKDGVAQWTGTPFYSKAAIATYAADGTEAFVKPSGTSYDALTNAATALVVDVTGTGITGITPNANPNTLYISDVPLTGLDDHNVVTYSGGSYTASNITLTDGSGFYSPVDFTATNIEFVYNNSKQADGTNGWNSLMLPFNVTSVTADGTSIDWFHSGTDTGKQFWVKKFVSDEANQVYFDYAEEMTANTPYIVALPGNHWGAAYDLSGKVIKFIGENVTVSKGDAMTSVTGSNYRFIGSTVQDNTANIYCLNAAGSAFALTDGSGPFRAYFKPGTFNSSVTMLGIGNWTGDATGIQGLGRETITDNIYYDLQGRRVEHPTKGVYVVNGKKVVIK